jgi:hypothetical protein
MGLLRGIWCHCGAREGTVDLCSEEGDTAIQFCKGVIQWSNDREVRRYIILPMHHEMMGQLKIFFSSIPIVMNLMEAVREL